MGYEVKLPPIRPDGENLTGVSLIPPVTTVTPVTYGSGAPAEQGEDYTRFPQPPAPPERLADLEAGAAPHSPLLPSAEDVAISGQESAVINQSHSLIKIGRPGLQIPGIVTVVGLELPPKLQYDHWAEIGHGLNRVDRGFQWWIGDWLNYGEQEYGKKYFQAIEDTGLDYQTLRDRAWVARRVQMSLRKDNLSWSIHKEVAKLEPKEQQGWLNRAEAEMNNDPKGRGWTARQLRAAICKELNPVPRIPEGKFFVIYADPPWAFDNSGFEQSAESQYPTITTDELCDRPDIAELVGEQGVLFLWVPNSMIEDGLRICEAWGFEYKTNRTWIKDRIPGIGWYVKSKHETLLIATRGQGVFPKEKPDSWFKAEVQGHSCKPDCVYTDIEAMYPGPYIELFARRTRKGWTSWGNEIREPEAP